MRRASRVKVSGEPHFPDRCVACGVKEPGASFVFDTTVFAVWMSLFGSRGRVHMAIVPVCPACLGPVKRRWRLRYLAFFAVATVPLVVAGLVWLGLARPPIGRGAMIGIVVASLGLFSLWSYLNPLPFDLDVEHFTVEYYFRDPDFAQEFAELNHVGPSDMVIRGKPKTPSES
jgi:hypothetical protein